MAGSLTGGFFGLPATRADQFIGGGTLPSVAGSLWVTGTYATVGLLIIRHRREHVIGWLFLGQGLLLGLAGLSFGYFRHAMHVANSMEAPTAQLAGWLLTVTLIPPGYLGAMLLILLFPDGRPPSDRWRPLAVVSVAASAVLAIGIALAPGPVLLMRIIDNPFGLPGVAGSVASVVVRATFIALLACAVAAVIAMIQRYRRAESIERHQLKWFAYGAVVALIGALAYALLGGTPASEVSAAAQDAVWLFAVLTLSALPIAAFVAMQRYRLYEVDTLISRTIVYGTLIALVAGVYTAAVRLATSAFETVTGQASDVALVFTTLVVVTSFTPIKTRLEAAVARRFKDPAPDAVDATDATDASAPASAIDDPELARRIEEIARRVANEVIDARTR